MDLSLHFGSVFQVGQSQLKRYRLIFEKLTFLVVKAKLNCGGVHLASLNPVMHPLFHYHFLNCYESHIMLDLSMVVTSLSLFFFI